MNRTDRIIASSVAVAASLGILGWVAWSLITGDTFPFAVTVGVIGILVVTVFPVWVLVRYVPRLIRSIRKS